MQPKIALIVFSFAAFINSWEQPTTLVSAADLVQLSPENWDKFAPQGKEVDCIYGDYVLQNELITAVIAEPKSGRNANMTVRDVGGSVIDLTLRSRSNDQLSAFYPEGGRFSFAVVATAPDTVEPNTAQLALRSEPTEGQPQVDLVYRLQDGDPALNIETTLSNPHEEAIEYELRDSMRADRSFRFDFSPELGLFWAYDDWWRQAYGVVPEGHEMQEVADTVKRKRPVIAYVHDGSRKIRIEPGKSHTLKRRLVPANHLLELKGQVAQDSGTELHPVNLTITDPRHSIYLANVELTADGKRYGSARTGHDGVVEFMAPAGDYTITVNANGREEKQVKLTIDKPTRETIEMPLPGYVVARIENDQGGPIPCKIEFRGKDSTADPDFGPDTFEHGVKNLYYTASGRFRQELAPGVYDVVISHGNEYDAVFTTIEIKRGETTRLDAELKRSVDTTGWISSDFHSHSSPSGDNTSSQRGRVLNLLSEHIEFAPCTEHNRVSTYIDHLKHFHAIDLMATCSGMELTGTPLPVNHQNAFPIKRKPRTQDGGGPTTDENPILQIERLALWDQRAQKVVQGNHPNLVQILVDRDEDGNADSGFENMFGHMDVVEVHPPHKIFLPVTDKTDGSRGNVMGNWLQMLNMGYRIPGVVNTDAHYNFHGSGWLRNYLKANTDDPAQLRLADLIQATERGNVVMTNGPYLEVTAMASGDRTAIAGEDIIADDGEVRFQVRVQCPNWLDINRIQLFINGVPVPEQNFTRRTHGELFGEQVVKFEQTLPLKLDADAHVIVAAAGEGLSLGPVAGPSHENDIPVAVTNPIFVDVDGDGFQPNGDLLGGSLP